VREAVVHAGAVRSRTFKLRHLSRILDVLPAATEPDPVARGRAVVARADARREKVGATLADNTPDPLGGPWKLYRDTAAEIRAQSIALVEALFGVTDVGDLPEVQAKRPRRRLRLGQR
jgi:hypothetical protein